LEVCYTLAGHVVENLTSQDVEVTVHKPNFGESVSYRNASRKKEIHAKAHQVLRATGIFLYLTGPCH